MALDTVQAVGVFVLAVLPGALYTWAYEREDGAWEVALSDRVARFTGVSAVFSVATAPLVGWLYRLSVTEWVRPDGVLRPPPWFWGIYALYVLVPVTLGTVVGVGAKRREAWTRYFTGPSPAPRGWDVLFRSPGLTGWLRLRLKDGTWVLGTWEDAGPGADGRPGSYAAGFPHAQDLYLVDTCEVDTESGEFLTDDDGAVIRRGIGVLVSWDQVAYAEFIDS